MMSDAINTFFDAWAETDAEKRGAVIAAAVSANIHYADPRTPEPVTSVEALNEYVGMFSANAPGWSAKVLKTDTTNGVARVTVAFGGPGPDGNDMVQHGQYFVEMEGESITRMTGFVGTGQPE